MSDLFFSLSFLGEKWFLDCIDKHKPQDSAQRGPIWVTCWKGDKNELLKRFFVPQESIFQTRDLIVYDFDIASAHPVTQNKFHASRSKAMLFSCSPAFCSKCTQLKILWTFCCGIKPASQFWWMRSGERKGEGESRTGELRMKEEKKIVGGKNRQRQKKKENPLSSSYFTDFEWIERESPVKLSCFGIKPRFQCKLFYFFPKVPSSLQIFFVVPRLQDNDHLQ